MIRESGAEVPLRDRRKGRGEVRGRKSELKVESGKHLFWRTSSEGRPCRGDSNRKPHVARGEEAGLLVVEVLPGSLHCATWCAREQRARKCLGHSGRSDK